MKSVVETKSLKKVKNVMETTQFHVMMGAAMTLHVRQTACGTIPLVQVLLPAEIMSVILRQRNVTGQILEEMIVSLQEKIHL